MRISRLIICVGYAFFITNLFCFSYLVGLFSSQPAIFNQIFNNPFMLLAFPIGALTTAVLSTAGMFRLVFAIEAKGHWQSLTKEIVNCLVLMGAILLPILIGHYQEFIGKVGFSVCVIGSFIFIAVIYRCYLGLDDLRVSHG